MKRTHYLVGLAAVLVACLVTAILTTSLQKPAAAQAPSAERFKLMQGTYNIMIQGDVQDTAVFRIDTQTGTTWKYITGMKEGKFTEGWARIPDQVETNR